MAPHGAALAAVRNIFLHQLPPTRQVGNRDCQCCTRRRIRCDRTIPECYKCQNRELSCPGYDPRLRWVQGVTSRGKLKGKSHPLQKTFTPLDTEGHDPGASGAASWTNISDPELFGNAELLSAKVPDHNILNTCTISTAVSVCLLQHFIQHVTPRLQWIDDDNPWRELLLPLSQTSLCLRLAILGLSATHLLATSLTSKTRAEELITLSHSYRDSCIKLLSSRMQNELSSESIEGDAAGGSNVTEIFATMVVLSYKEFFQPEIKEWRLHLRACRAICTRQRLFNEPDAVRDQTILFLEKAVSQFQFFELPSSFLARQIAPSATPATFEDAFWTFTVVLHKITSYERSIHDNVTAGNSREQVDMAVWRDHLDEAYSSVSSSSSMRCSSLVQHRELFRHVLNAHYNAALIYAYQALMPGDAPPHFIQSVLDQLISCLESIASSKVRDFDHDLFWPLFIAGTEVRQKEFRQAVVRDYFHRLINSSGFRCNYRALSFLQTFWSDPIAELSENWIEYARHNVRSIDSFLLY